MPLEMQPTLVEMAAGNQPLIDIDGTVLIQFVLFAVMFFAANKLLFQPYLKLRAKRIAGIDGARAEAERMSAEADGKLADYETKLAAARAKATAEQRKIRAEAAAHEREVSDKARASAQAAMDTATATVKRETEAARGELVPQAQLIARRMTKQLLGREIS
jgi:F-type H+-transporting ATPase subunit b